MAENKKEPRKRGKKEKKGNKFALGVAVLGIVFIAGCYTVKANTYRTKFFPHTIINGIDASEKTVDEVTACGLFCFVSYQCGAPQLCSG